MRARILVPPIVAFGLVIGYLASEALGFGVLERPQGDTVSEAAALGHAARTLQLIREGQAPGRRHHVGPAILDAGEYELTPLEAAILGRHVELVLLLRRTESTGDDSRAICYARARLPEVLPELGVARPPTADEPVEIASAISVCAQEQ